MTGTMLTFNFTIGPAAATNTTCGGCEQWCTEDCMAKWHYQRMLDDPPLPILPRRIVPECVVPAEAVVDMYEPPLVLERGLLPELDETYLPVLSEGNKGVPFPRCLAGLAQAVALTLGALFAHRGEVWRMWRGR